MTISATLDGITGSTGLTVTAAVLKSIAVTPANTSLPTGETEQFTATGTFSDNSTENLTSQVTWASSDTTWATISSHGAGHGRVAGPVTISATLDGITGYDRSDGDRRDAPVDRGDAGQYEPAHRGNRAVHRHRHVLRQLDREPDQPGDLGLVRHHLGHDQRARAGHGRVARPRDDLGDPRRHHRLDRADGDRGGAQVDRGHAGQPQHCRGTTQQFTATGTFTDGTTENLTSSVSWTSSNLAVATINAAGVATGLGAGSSTITATSGSVSAETTLTVNNDRDGFRRLGIVGYSRDCVAPDCGRRASPAPGRADYGSPLVRD